MLYEVFMVMAEAVPLQNERDVLKRHLAANEYATLPDQIVRGIGNLLQKITHNPKPIPFWYSVLIIYLIIILTGSGLSIVLSEFNPKPIVVMIVGIGLIYTGLLLFKVHHNNFTAQLREHIVDSIESSHDLHDLQHWLHLTANTKAAMLFSGAVAVFGGLFVWFVYSSIGEFFGFGPTVAFVLSFFLYGAMVYYAILFSGLPNRLSRYPFKLYDPDPSSSGLIHHLSVAFMDALSLFALYAALITFVTAIEGLLVSFNIVRLLGWWAFLTGLFALVQHTLSKIITTAKYKTLSEVEVKIEQLLSHLDPNDKEAREGINWLMDYHDRIKSTPNSVLHVRALLEFVNSLILPLLAFVLANLKEIVDLFR
jgi:hypothetical protein